MSCLLYFSALNFSEKKNFNLNVSMYSYNISWPQIDWQSQSISRSSNDLNSEFSFSQTGYYHFVQGNIVHIPWYSVALLVGLRICWQ